MPLPHVLILGAGLSGLTLAQCLRKQDISFEIFERDAGLHGRPESWPIALQSVLEDLVSSLPSDLPPLESTHDFGPSDVTAEPSFCKGPRKGSVGSFSLKPAIRANEQKLLELLSRDIDIRWGMNAARIEQDGKEVRLIFEDGEIVDGDVLIGADGADSFVRSQVIPPAQYAIPKGRVTLIGDAAHAMMPFPEEEGCHAIQDALDLSKILNHAGNDYEAIMEVFQVFAKEILPRSREVATGSRTMPIPDAKSCESGSAHKIRGKSLNAGEEEAVLITAA